MTEEQLIHVASGIRLGQFLKIAALVETGGEAKYLIESGLVRVNGEVETRRGRQLSSDDRVELEDVRLRVSIGGP